jgi:hypothetical protein
MSADEERPPSASEEQPASDARDGDQRGQTNSRRSKRKTADDDEEEPRPQTRADGAGSPVRNEKIKKQILTDLEAMEHRISKLRVEEFRNQATVKALDRQLQTVESRKQNYQRTLAERRRREEARRQAQDDQREAIATARQRQRENIQEALERSLDAKRDQVDDVRRMRRIHECERELQVATARERIINQHDSVRETDSRVKTKAMRQAARKIEGIRERERREMAHDAAEREEKERKLRKLADEEEKLRLRVEEIRRTRNDKMERLHTADGSTRRRPRPASQQKPRGERQSAADRSSDKLPPL